MSCIQYRLIHRFEGPSDSKSKYRGVVAELPMGNVILIKDDFSSSKPTMSVTNNAEQVVSEIAGMLMKRRLDIHTLDVGSKPAKIFYIDTSGDIDEIVPLKWQTSSKCTEVTYARGHTEQYVALFDGV